MKTNTRSSLPRLSTAIEFRHAGARLIAWARQFPLSRPGARAALFGILLGLSLVPIWLVRYPPLQDYPDWLLQAQILRRLHDPTFSFADHYTLQTVPVPNLGGVALIYLFSLVAPIEVPRKLAMSVYLLALTLSIRYWLRTTQGRPSALEFLSLLAGYNYFFSRGYLSYVLALALFFLLLGFVWRQWPGLSNLTASMLALGIILLFLAHFIPWAAFVFVAASWAWLRRKNLAQGDILRMGVALAPSLILLTLYAAT